ncbi:MULTISPECIES: DUF2235 domain-containing protein [unclassified Burkholderia]|uniref:DUF2235 domain-containing protein n=1 Tax=unclassified Burkholderia TaxID=2613784 RepID=UPI000F55F423|nr:MULTISPECIES: DUF2235 domain-containing protein [unclassified Burkholderia]RQR42454.1 hypothetical protein DIE22_01120 [Burkholderia sp. Bp9142]RQR56665.1 hypothetical protein DIE21_02675 [Burkholderia sp. Bp9140]
MAENAYLDPDDQTPVEVRAAIGESRRAYPHDACIPCGAVVHMGFFFDGFGRHRDFDDKSSSRYSNVCRLWEAHRNITDRRRPSVPNQFWYRFYFSGLGTELNSDVRDGLAESVVWKLAGESVKAAKTSAASVGKKATGVDRLPIDPKGALTDAFKKGIKEFSYRPIAKTFNDLAESVANAPRNVGRVLSLYRENRWIRRGRAATRAILYDTKKNFLSIGWSTAKSVFLSVGIDSIPWFRDNRAVARAFGTGVEDRLTAALNQFENAIDDVRQKMPKIQRIQVSIFGADRGCVLARALANELTRKYKHPTDTTLAFVHPKDPNYTVIPVEIKFLGLLDAVSSLMEENTLLGMVPILGLLKQNYGDRELSVPASVQRCVHFAAAHELRFYQRLDSLEKTRGLQYLYPGTSEDITGGAPPGMLGARAELQRVVLRDMLNEAISHGVVLDTMEDMAKWKPELLQRFTLAQPISDGKTAYRIGELIDAYRQIVPHVARLNFVEHMQVFLRWMAVRYQSPAFRATVTSRFDQLAARHREMLKERNEAEAAYVALRNQRPPVDSGTLGKAYARWQDAILPEMLSGRDTGIEKARPSVGVWERIESEFEALSKRQSRQTGVQKSIDVMREREKDGTLPWDADPEFSIGVFEAEMLTPEQESLIQAWKMGLSGKNPLPPKVMALFDLLVHDTMLTSWHDHMLSSTLYFQTRATDTFGSSDYVNEEKKRERDEKHGERVRQATEAMSPGARPTGPARSPSQSTTSLGSSGTW